MYPNLTDCPPNPQIVPALTDCTPNSKIVPRVDRLHPSVTDCTPKCQILSRIHRLYAELTHSYPNSQLVSRIHRLYPVLTSDPHVSDCTPVFAARYEEDEITDERVSEYKHTTSTFTQQCQDDPSEHQTSQHYPEPTNKSSALIAALLSDFDEAKARYEDDDRCGDEW